MNAVGAFRPTCCCTYRWSGRATALLLFVIWAALALAEGLPVHGVPLSLAGQAIVLAVVFAGYALSWRHEFGGAILSLAGVAAFYVLTYVDLHVLPGLAFAMFALPPVLFLVSWQLAKREATPPEDPLPGEAA